MNNELKVSFYLKREGNTERTETNPDAIYPIVGKNHHRQHHCTIQFQVKNRRAALECEIRSGYGKKPCSQ